jgi:hypothetical protein
MKLTEKQLCKLSTKRILAYKRKYVPSSNYPFEYDDYIWDCDCSLCMRTKDDIKEYHEHYKLVKTILSEREHIDKEITNGKI